MIVGVVNLWGDLAMGERQVTIFLTTSWTGMINNYRRTRWADSFARCAQERDGGFETRPAGWVALLTLVGV